MQFVQDQSVSFLKDIIAQRFGVRVAVFICGGVILDANDDKMSVCQHPRLTMEQECFCTRYQ